MGLLVPVPIWAALVIILDWLVAVPADYEVMHPHTKEQGPYVPGDEVRSATRSDVPAQPYLPQLAGKGLTGML